jgi:hypothetical protein
MKLLLMQSSPASCQFCQFLSLGCIYFPHHPVLRYPSRFLYILIFKFLERRWENKRFWTAW